MFVPLLTGRPALIFSPYLCQLEPHPAAIMLQSIAEDESAVGPRPFAESHSLRFPPKESGPSTSCESGPRAGFPTQTMRSGPRSSSFRVTQPPCDQNPPPKKMVTMQAIHTSWVGKHMLPSGDGPSISPSGIRSESEVHRTISAI